MEPFDRREFIAFWMRADRCNHGFRAMVPVAIFLAGIGLFIPFSRWLRTCGVPDVVLVILFFVYLLTFPLLFSVLSPRVPKPFRRCPNCGDTINHGTRRIIIASGRCGNCGEKILAGPDDDTAS